jgi:hypothetical protein
VPKQTEQEVERVYGLIMEGKTDRQIIEILQINRRTFYRYKDKVIDRIYKIFGNQTRREIPLHKDLLRERLNTLYMLAQKKIESTVDSQKGELNPSKDFSGTVAIAQELAVNIWRLDTQGIEVLTGGGLNNDRLNTIERKIQGSTRVLQSQDSTEPQPIV